MTRLWISLLLLLSMLGGSLYNAHYLEQLTDDLTDSLTAAQEMAQRSAWDQAELLTRQALSEWNDRHNYLHIALQHSDTDEILISFRSVLQYLSLEEMDQYAAANLQLITQISLLAEMEQADWLNVL